MQGHPAIVIAVACLLLVTCARPLSQAVHQPERAVPASLQHEHRAAQQTSGPLAHAVLPAEGEARDYRVTEPPKVYVGEELFDLIDGGAVQFFAHGFEWAVAGMYEREGGGSVSAEVYRMRSSKGAEAVFGERGTEIADSADVGEDSRITYTSVEFRRGAFYVLVAGYEAGEPGRRAALDLARAIDLRLATK